MTGRTPEAEPESATIVLDARGAAAILAGLGLLDAHASDGYEAPWLLEVGERFTGCEPLSVDEIATLRAVISEAFT